MVIEFVRVVRITQNVMTRRWFGLVALRRFDDEGALVEEYSREYKFMEEPTRAEVEAIARDTIAADAEQSAGTDVAEG